MYAYVCHCMSVCFPQTACLPQNKKKLNETLGQKEKLYPYVKLFSSMAQLVKKKKENKEVGVGSLNFPLRRAPVGG